jgi:hypothetical protein
VDAVEQRGSQLLRARRVEQKSDPARQERVLDRHDRGVAAVHVLDRACGVGIHPPGAGRCDGDEHLTFERSVRSNSATARSTRSATESAESSPTYTRIGSSAVMSGSNDSISAIVGAPATKLRPSNPNVSQSTSDAGLPEAVGDVGGSTPSAVVPSKVPKFVSAQLAKLRAAKLEPISRPAVTIAATVSALPAAAFASPRRGRCARRNAAGAGRSRR